mmetsp:Transcript_62620/g.71848  ORF Transcript_62620/g.71848 Transcript_62620/m.71848 type:complete len:383 (-) Transcript_62620:218-1366(-)
MDAETINSKRGNSKSQNGTNTGTQNSAKGGNGGKKRKNRELEDLAQGEMMMLMRTRENASVEETRRGKLLKRDSDSFPGSYSGLSRGQQGSNMGTTVTPNANSTYRGFNDMYAETYDDPDDAVTLAQKIYSTRIEYGNLVAGNLVQPDVQYVPFLHDISLLPTEDRPQESEQSVNDIKFYMLKYMKIHQNNDGLLMEAIQDALSDDTESKDSPKKSEIKKKVDNEPIANLSQLKSVLLMGAQNMTRMHLKHAYFGKRKSFYALCPNSATKAQSGVKELEKDPKSGDLSILNHTEDQQGDQRIERPFVYGGKDDNLNHFNRYSRNMKLRAGSTTCLERLPFIASFRHEIDNQIIDIDNNIKERSDELVAIQAQINEIAYGIGF